MPHQRLDIAGDRDRAAGVLDQLPLGVVERAAVDVGRIRLQRLRGMELFEQRIAAELADADVDGDGRADVARRLELREQRLGRTAGRQEQRRQLIVAGEILLAQPRDIARIFGRRDLPDPAGFVLPGAVGEDRPDARIHQPLDAGVGVLRRILDVRPVEHAGHAGVDGAERAEQVRRVDVVRRHLGAERALHHVAVVFERAVRQDVAQEALPHVPVGIDESRHHDRVRRVDHLGVRRIDVRPHRGDALALDQHVGLFEVADRTIERQHAAALEQDRPARRRAGGLLGLRGSHRGAGDRRAGDCRRCNRAGRGGAEELTPRQPPAGSTGMRKSQPFRIVECQPLESSR